MARQTESPLASFLFGLNASQATGRSEAGLYQPERSETRRYTISSSVTGSHPSPSDMHQWPLGKSHRSITSQSRQTTNSAWPSLAISIETLEGPSHRSMTIPPSPFGTTRMGGARAASCADWAISTARLTASPLGGINSSSSSCAGLRPHSISFSSMSARHCVRCSSSGEYSLRSSPSVAASVWTLCGGSFNRVSAVSEQFLILPSPNTDEPRWKLCL